MKYILIYLIAFLAMYGRIWPQKWKLVCPVTQSPPQSINDIHAFDSLNAIIVGDFPGVGCTSDGGRSWNYTTIPSPDTNVASYNSICFSDEKNGWVAGTQFSVAHTTDGGLTWHWKRLISNIFGYWNSIFFTDSLHGWAVGIRFTNYECGVFARTTNGGVSWEISEPDTTFSGMNVCAFADTLRGWAGGGRECLVETTDGGLTWKRINDKSIASIYQSIDISPQGRITISGDGCSFSTDRGKTWSERKLLRNFTIFLSERRGISAGSIRSRTSFPPDYYITDDGGQTWQPQNFAPELEFADVDSENSLRKADDGSLWITTMRGKIMRSLDSGFTWQRLTPTSERFNEIAFSTPSVGWVRGEYGGNSLWKTTDAGLTWSQQFPRDTAQFIVRGPVFADSANGWYIRKGTPTTLERTRDGGATWQTATSTLPNPSVIGLYAISPALLYIRAIGQPNEWYRSKDSGKTWEFYDPFVVSRIYSIAVKGNIGFAAGFIGEMLASHDGGYTWSYLETHLEPEQVYSAAIIDSFRWWIGGKNGYLMNTTDGGRTWTNKGGSKISGNLFNITFINNRIGSMYVSGAYIYSTTDGGENWSVITTEPFRVRTITNDLTLSPDGTFWACGDNGMIISWKPDIASSVANIFESNDLIIFPNPVSDYFNVSTPDNSTVTARDVFGRVMYSGDSGAVSVSGWPQGIYFIETTDSSGRRNTAKIIVTR